MNYATEKETEENGVCIDTQYKFFKLKQDKG